MSRTLCEIRHALESSLSTRATPPKESIADILRVFDEACEVATATRAPPIGRYISIKMGGAGGGKSRKVGNVWLDIRKLVAAFAKTTLSAASIAANPWTAPLAGLIIWDELVSRTTVEVEERDATVVWTLWINRDANALVAKHALLAMVNEERSLYGRAVLTAEELTTSLELLKKVGCIQEFDGDPLFWWVCERVCVDLSD